MIKDKKKPPIFRTWTGAYLFVVIFLVLQIVFYYLFTHYFR